MDMKRIKSVLTAFCLTAAMLSAYAPIVAEAATSIDLYSFAMISNKQSASFESSPEAYNVSWDSTDIRTYNDHMYQSPIWKSWFDINYNTIAEGKDWTTFCMEFTNGTMVPGLTKDFSDVKDSGYAIFSVETDAEVDTDNLYFVIETKTNDDVIIAGVPAKNYITAGSGEKKVAVPLADFEKSFLASRNGVQDGEIDLSHLFGMGLYRCRGEENSQSSGRIIFSGMKIVNLDAIGDLEASAVKNKIQIEFTVPEVATADRFYLNIKGTNGTERNLILKAEDFTVENGKYIWFDSDIEAEVSYTYKIKMSESDYGIYSVYSNMSSALVSEDNTGEDIPDDGENSVVLDYSNRSFRWPLPNGIYWYQESYGAFKEDTINVYANAADAKMGSGTIASYKMDYNMRYDSTEKAEEKQSFIYDWYWSGYVGSAFSQKGGETGKDDECINMQQYQNTGYVVYELNIDSGVDLENLYFALSNRYADGEKATGNIIGVPVTDYISDEDKGKVFFATIPLKDFTLSNPHAYQSMQSFPWQGAKKTGIKELDFTHFSGIGFLRMCEGIENRESTGLIYCSDMMLCNVKPVSDFRVYDIRPNKISLTWKHSDTKAEKYLIYRADNGEKKRLIGESKTNKFIDYNDGTEFNSGESFEYFIEAVDSKNAKSTAVSAKADITGIDCPRNFRAVNRYSDTADIEAKISWDKPIFGDVAEYVLYRNGAEYKHFSTDEALFTDTDINEYQTYTYSMQSVGTDGTRSKMTENISVTAAAVAAPENLSYQITQDNKISLSWDGVEYAESYDIYVNGSKIDSSSLESFVYSDTLFDVQYVVGVAAINRAGAHSVTVKTSEFCIRNPEIQSLSVIFDDTIKNSFQQEVSGKAQTSISSKIRIKGEKSLMCDFSEKAFGDHSVGFAHAGFNMKAYRDSGAALAFWLYSPNKTDYNNIQIALGTKTTLSWTTVSLLSKVKLSDYVSGSGEWKRVVIPLADFSGNGCADYNGQTVTQNIDFEKIKDILVICQNVGDETDTVLYLDDIEIEAHKSWSIISSVNNTDQPLDSNTVSAATKSLKVKFNCAMDVSSLTGNTVYLMDKNGTVINTFGEYNESEKSYTLNLLEALEQNSDYTLVISGAKNENGSGTEKRIKFSTDSAIPTELTYKIPDIAPQAAKSQNGECSVITFTLPKNIIYNAKSYSFDISVNQDVVKLNGTGAIKKLDGLSNAKISVLGDKINIKADTVKVINGDWISIELVPVASGIAEVTLSGTANIYNANADKMSSADIKARYSYNVTKAVSASGGSSSGGSNSYGSSGADRSSSTVPSTTPVVPSKQQTQGAEFSDIDEVAWAADSIRTLASKGILSGYPDNTFKPKNEVTREEFAVMLTNLFELSTENAETSFKDIPEDAWYKKYVAAAERMQIISGVGESNFGVGMKITREDMCTMLYRAMTSMFVRGTDKFDFPLFEDIGKISDYASEPIRELYSWGIVNGVSDTEFAPDIYVTRAMAARLLCGALEFMN